MVVGVKMVSHTSGMKTWLNIAHLKPRGRLWV